ncbi:MAG: hypothetical protein KGQ67_10070 [Betaproteobacteria bacterium]|nr:hypothetical protein [Betaproteobacteria bacterium]
MADSPSVGPLFGARLDGVPVVLPSGVPLVYLADVLVHPLAGAAPRVCGLMQMQGLPLVVLDPTGKASSPVARRLSVLVVGEPGEGAALRVDEPPSPIAVAGPRPDAPRPVCVFAAALERPVADALDPDRIWWHVVPARLFALLAAATAATGTGAD